MSDQRDRLRIDTIGLHWLLAVAMIGMLVFGLVLEDMPKGDAKSALMWWHKGLGVAILVLAVWRFGLRMSQGFPEALSPAPAWQETISTLTHWFLLLGTLFMPISGMLMSLSHNRSIDVLGLFTIPAFGEIKALHDVSEAVHGLGGNLLIAAVILHVVGAIKHEAVDKDGTMARMAGRRVPARDEA